MWNSFATEVGFICYRDFLFRPPKRRKASTMNTPTEPQKPTTGDVCADCAFDVAVFDLDLGKMIIIETPAFDFDLNLGEMIVLEAWEVEPIDLGEMTILETHTFDFDLDALLVQPGEVEPIELCEVPLLGLLDIEAIELEPIALGACLSCGRPYS
jgi:hypothetical protein